jgi:hypothetical protein
VRDDPRLLASGLYYPTQVKPPALHRTVLVCKTIGL